MKLLFAGGSVADRFIQRLARWRANGLGFTQNFAGTHHGARAMLAAHETGHGRAAKRGGCHKGRAGNFGLVAQAVR